MAEKKSVEKKRAVNLPDLIPQKDPRGEGAGRMYPEGPALPIPPPGFVSENAAPDEGR